MLNIFRKKSRQSFDSLKALHDQKNRRFVSFYDKEEK